MEATYIAHYGIEGQKWGKRNGPPYPLKESSKSYAEKKESTENKKEHTRKTVAKVAGLSSLAVSTAVVGHAFVTASIAAGTLSLPLASVPAAIGLGVNYASRIVTALAETD